MNIIKSILTNNPCYKTNRKINVKGLMLHSVGCSQPSAQVFVRNWDNASFNRACVHAFIDGNTGDVYQTLPWNHRGWHCGSQANNTHIGVEMCEPSTIKYTSGAVFTVTDIVNAKEVATRTYNSAVELFAKLCTDYNLDPMADGVIISHAEGYKQGVASNHADPEHLWRGLHLPYTMDTFRTDVKNKMNNKNENNNAETNTTESTHEVLYKVQVGAFSVRENAEKMLEKVKKAGFDAFITVVTK